MAMELLQVHHNGVQYEKTDFVVPWTVLKTYKINNKPITEETLIYLVGHLKNNGFCKIGITAENERVSLFLGFYCLILVSEVFILRSSNEDCFIKICRMILYLL